MRPAFVLSLSVLAALAGPLPARADDASEAQLQYELGAELYRQRRLTEALERFLASNRLVPNQNVAFNIAQVYALLDRPVDAYNWWEEHLSFELDAPTRAGGVQARDRLASRVAVLDVTSTPPRAAIFVDRTELGSVGKSPRRVAVTPGSHVLKLRLEGHRDAEVPVTVALGETVAVPVTLTALVGTVRVESFPPGAAVRIEGAPTDLGRTPFETTLPVGEVRLTATLPGHVEQTRAVTIRTGETTALRLRLAVEAGTVASLSVTGSPAGARVSIDGRDVGPIPFTQSGVEPGTVSLSVAAPGRDPWHRNVLLEAGAATRVRVRLVGEDDRAWPGWRWIGYGGGGALLIGGAVVGLLALSEHSAFDDNPTGAGHDRLGSLNLAADLLAIAGVVVLGTTFVIDMAAGPTAVSTGRVDLDR